ncbi:hypothetical protein SOPP22_17400 [Shewanella sp. OPT22]|nr:hypothetical protein SOPP22_17400 [Shewanella sp. OPT22]
MFVGASTIRQAFVKSLQTNTSNVSLFPFSISGHYFEVKVAKRNNTINNFQVSAPLTPTNLPKNQPTEVISRSSWLSSIRCIQVKSAISSVIDEFFSDESFLEIEYNKETDIYSTRNVTLSEDFFYSTQVISDEKYDPNRLCSKSSYENSDG